jgi:membrane protein DedA with SNARE-associated domain
VLIGRVLPIVRTFISLPAGVARMPFWRFTVLTVIGCIPWVLMLGLVGREVGDNWEQWRDNLHYLDYAVLAAIVVTVAYLLLRRRRGAGQESDGEPAPETPA